jgi:hypothetical protein
LLRFLCLGGLDLRFFFPFGRDQLKELVFLCSGCGVETRDERHRETRDVGRQGGLLNFETMCNVCVCVVVFPIVGKGPGRVSIFLLFPRIICSTLGKFSSGVRAGMTPQGEYFSFFGFLYGLAYSCLAIPNQPCFSPLLCRTCACMFPY